MINRRIPLAALTAALLTAACSGTADTDNDEQQHHPGPSTPPAGDASPEASSPSPTEPGMPGADPVIREVPVGQWEEMVAAGMWREGCPVTRQELRRVEINHIDFDGEVARGVLVVNADVAESVVRVFTLLYQERFPIRQMRPVEAYNGDSDASLADDNTAAYNCRRPDQINAPPMESPHANGRAIDINPLENPWMDPRCECWSPSAEFQAREEGPGVILKGGPVWQAFTDEGWIWQNIDVPDYMHFDTGYPSTPFTPNHTGPGS